MRARFQTGSHHFLQQATAVFQNATSAKDTCFGDHSARCNICNHNEVGSNNCLREKFQTEAKVQKNSYIIYRSHVSLLPVRLKSPFPPSCNSSFLAPLTSIALESSTPQRSGRLSASSRLTCQRTDYEAVIQGERKQSSLRFPDALFQKLEPYWLTRNQLRFMRRKAKHGLWNDTILEPIPNFVLPQGFCIAIPMPKSLFSQFSLLPS